MSDKPVEFGSKPEMTPEQKADYDNRIRAARGQSLPVKRNTPVGHVAAPSMPNLREAASVSTRNSNIGEQLQQGVQPRPPGSPVITQRTADQISEMQEAMKHQPAAAPAPTPATPEKAEVPKIDDDLWDALNLGDVRNEAERIHNNKARKQAIESRCEPMDFDDLLWKGEVQQRVQINPGIFEVTFKSINGEENLFIRRYMAKQKRVSDAHDLDIYSLCQLTISTVSLHGRTDRIFDQLTDREGNIDEAIFTKKLKLVSGLALPILADLSVNHNWFDLRVRRLINPDDLKNG